MQRRIMLGVGIMLMALIFGVSAETGHAQTIAVDYTKAHAIWDEPTLAGVPTSYTLKCATTAGGPYTKTKNYPVALPLTTTNGIVPLSDLITTSGTYFCVVSASGVIGESANSTEVTFQAGRLPAVPASLAITAN